MCLYAFCMRTFCTLSGPAALSGSKALMTFSSLSSFIILLVNSVGCLLVGVLKVCCVLFCSAATTSESPVK